LDVKTAKLVELRKKERKKYRKRIDTRVLGRGSEY
jgi:hypothetical protein